MQDFPTGKQIVLELAGAEQKRRVGWANTDRRVFPRERLVQDQPPRLDGVAKVGYERSMKIVEYQCCAERFFG